ncbi:hypothetical protein AB0K05_39885 [Nonomuraea sp. NPDC049486]|uniref:hypothetical protein n=1 Tax=Nonomuraea sp. NPDC049486 TaxID=3155773 RepID=UPI00343C78DB
MRIGINGFGRIGRAILRSSTDPLVSRDVIGDAAPCVVDSGLTRSGGDLVKVLGCYDNAWGCADRLVEMAQRMEEPACQR